MTVSTSSAPVLPGDARLDAELRKNCGRVALRRHEQAARASLRRRSPPSILRAGSFDGERRSGAGMLVVRNGARDEATHASAIVGIRGCRRRQSSNCSARARSKTTRTDLPTSVVAAWSMGPPLKWKRARRYALLQKIAMWGLPDGLRALSDCELGLACDGCVRAKCLKEQYTEVPKCAQGQVDSSPIFEGLAAATLLSKRPIHRATSMSE
jgi:hypothetical protein